MAMQTTTPNILPIDRVVNQAEVTNGAKPTPKSTHGKSSHDRNKPIYMYLGQRIKERRRQLKMNQTQMAQLMGFSYQQMQKYENGISEISVSKLLRIAKILNVSPTFFYEGAPLDDAIGKGIESDLIQKTRTEPLRVLLVENNANDVVLFKKAMSSCSEQVDIHIIYDSDMVQDFLQNHENKYGKAQPDIIILDLSLSKVSGLELLKSIKRNSNTQETPVLVLTHSISKKEMHDAYRYGAAGFIQKNVDLKEYTDAIDIAMKYWGRVVSLPHM